MQFIHRSLCNTSAKLIWCNHNINVLEVTQSILQDMFAMIMMVDISKADIPFTEFSDMLGKTGAEMGLSIHAMHEDIFNAMHTI